jgi:NAD(P)-dependent dehydrogenase (short-subunit alcohol dehydrogenase family)
MDALFDVRDKVALVTGGASGIGYMIAEGLLRAGAKVYLCGRIAERLAEAATALRQFGICIAVPADVATQAGCQTLASVIREQNDALNILVNNAGAVWNAPLETYPREAFRKVLQTNLAAPFELVQQCLPLLRAGNKKNGVARVVNISSLGAISPPNRETYAYSASKAGLNMLTRHLARTLAPEGITVNAIAPGVFRSRMTAPFFNENGTQDEWNIPLRRTGTMEDIAGAVIFLASRAGAYLTGTIIVLAGGMEFTA